MTAPSEPPRDRRVGLSFQTRLTLTLLAAAIVPLGVFGLVLIATDTIDPQVGSRLLLFMFAVAVAVGILAGAAIGLDLVRPLREISAAVQRVSAGDLSQPIPVDGNDVLAQLAESHNRLAADAQRRNRQLGLILAAVESAEPRDGVDALADRAARDAETAFGFIAAVLQFVDPDTVEPEERIPGVSLPIRAELRAGDERMGIILASLPATQTWERADQALLDLFASEIGVAIRNAELFGQVQEKNVQLRHLSEVKDDFLRGVSHNLQTPLTSIRSNADALAGAGADPDPRLAIISEQADRLSRMVQQLLLVSRLESQPPRPTADVLAVGPRIQRAWDGLGVTDRAMTLHDGAAGLAGRRRRRPARPGAVGPARQRREVRRGRDHRRGRRRPRQPAGLDDDRRPRSRPRRQRPGVAVRAVRARRGGSFERQRQWPRPVRVARPDARDGRRPRAGSGRPGPRGVVPADPARRAGQRGVALHDTVAGQDHRPRRTGRLSSVGPARLTTIGR